MRLIIGLLLFSVLWASSVLATPSLEYSIELENGELRKNIQAWLGDPPETEQARSRFLATLDDRLAKSLQALGYYRPDINVHTDKTVQPWQLTITVRPKEPVRYSSVSIQVVGEAESNAEFSALIESESPLVGDVLHHGNYESLKRSIQSLGQSLGYFDGRIETHAVEVDASGTSATLELRYNSGQRFRFGQLLVDDKQFDRELIDSLRTFEEGDYFSLKQVQKFQAKLQQTRFFSSTVVRPELAQAKNKRIPLRIALYPAARHNFDLGLGYSTDTRERVSFTWRSPKLNRYGHSQETRIEYSPVNPSGRFTYNIPLTHPLNDILQLGARVEDNEFGDITSLQRELSVRREIRSDGAWVRSYSLRTLNESWNLQGSNRDNAYLLPGISFSHKRRKGLLVDPQAGFSQLYLLEGGAKNLASDIDLIRAYSNFTFVTTLAARHRMVIRAELGAAIVSDSDRPDLAPSLNFFAGGSQSIRGFGYQSIGNEIEVPNATGETKTLTVGGDRLVTASLEYQYYVNETWRGAIFVDAGDAFDEGEFEGHVGAGFGVHYLTPVGAIKLELANSVSKDNPEWRLHINIGAEF